MKTVNFKRLAVMGALSLTPFVTFAGSVTTNSQSQTQAQSAASNSGNNLASTNNFAAAHVPSDTTVRMAPNLGGNSFYGSFSTDNCMVSGGGGVSLVGLAVNGVTPIRDKQCSVLRGVERTMQVAATISHTNPTVSAKLEQGAIDMLCSLNETVGDALHGQGVCTVKKEQIQNDKKISSNMTQDQIEHQYFGDDPVVLRRMGMVATK